MLGPGGAGGYTPLKPQREGGSLLIGLPAEATASPRELQLVYSAPIEKAAGRGDVHVPAPRLRVRADRQTAAVEVPLADLTWKVRLPEGYEIVRTEGTLTPDNLPQPQSAVANVAAAAYLLAGGVNRFYNNRLP